MKENKNNNSVINPNDTAYPFICDGYVSGGLTLRQYFAAMAMQLPMMKEMLGAMVATDRIPKGTMTTVAVANISIMIADALIEALNADSTDKDKERDVRDAE